MAKNTVFQNPYVRVSFKYGGVGGIFAVFIFYVIIAFGENPLLGSPADFLVNLVVLVIFIVFSVKEFKKAYNGGYLHFWQGMNVGILTVTIIALISSLFILLYLNWIDPDLLDSYKASMEEIMNSNKSMFIEEYGEETFKSTLSKNAEVSPMDLAVDEFLKKKVFAGLFITLIVSVVMRRSPVTINK